MLSVPGWCICSRLQRVIYFLPTVTEEGLYQDADCWCVLIASLLEFWRLLGEEAWVSAASGLTLSKHAEKGRGECPGFRWDRIYFPPSRCSVSTRRMLITLLFSDVAMKSRTFPSFSYPANEQVCRSWEGAWPAREPSWPVEIFHTMDIVLSL